MTDQANIESPFRPGQEMIRVGLFGGTFDPVHLGHLYMAEEVRDAFGIETVYVVPAAAPPHKTWKRISDPEDRLAMVRLCFGNRAGFEVSDAELNRKGLSFTIDTIRSFSSSLGPRDELMMVAGTDAFFEIHTWREYEGILNRVPLIVVMRPDDDGTEKDFPMERMIHYLWARVSDGYTWDPDRKGFFHPTDKPIYLFQGTPRPVSSTDIRRKLKNRDDVTSLLSREVHDYIIEKGLYT